MAGPFPKPLLSWPWKASKIHLDPQIGVDSNPCSPAERAFKHLSKEKRYLRGIMLGVRNLSNSIVFYSDLSSILRLEVQYILYIYHKCTYYA